MYACDPQPEWDKHTEGNYTSDGKRIDNTGWGMCFNIETKNSPNLEIEVKNCTFIGEDDVTLSRDGQVSPADGRTKSRGHAIALNAISGGDSTQLKSLLIEGNEMTGLRGNAIQLYNLCCPATIAENKINSWGRNSSTANFAKSDAAIRGDYNAGADLTLTHNYFGMAEEWGDHGKGKGVVHVYIGSFAGNTSADDAHRAAGWY